MSFQTFYLVLEIKEPSGCAWQWFQNNTMLGWMHFDAQGCQIQHLVGRFLPFGIDYYRPARHAAVMHAC